MIASGNPTASTIITMVARVVARLRGSVRLLTSSMKPIMMDMQISLPQMFRENEMLLNFEIIEQPSVADKKRHGILAHVSEEDLRGDTLGDPKEQSVEFEEEEAADNVTSGSVATGSRTAQDIRSVHMRLGSSDSDDSGHGSGNGRDQQ